MTYQEAENHPAFVASINLSGLDNGNTNITVSHTFTCLEKSDTEVSQNKKRRTLHTVRKGEYGNTAVVPTDQLQINDKSLTSEDLP